MGPNRAAPVRPLFFAGQALTDRDLTDLVGWADRRFALRRHTAGWGVACGLDVTADRKNPGRLFAGPGYAVDPSGKDLQLAEPIWADIQNDSGWKAYADTVTGKAKIGPFDEVPLKDIAAFDVALVAAADERQPALAGFSGCSTACKPTRSADTAKLVLTRAAWDSRPGDPEGEPDTAIADLFKAVEAKAGNLFKLVNGQVFDSTRSPAIRQLLAGEFSQHPERWLRTFPDLPRWIEDRTRDGREYPGTPWELSEILGWMVDSYRQAHRECPAADPKAGVPLARAWFRVNWRRPEVLFIQNHPPYRRMFAPDPAGPLDPRRFIGYSFHAAKVELRRAHVGIEREQYESPASPALLKAELEHEAKNLGGSIDPGETVIAIAVPGAADSVLANRIVGAYQGVAANVRKELTKPNSGLKIDLFKAAKAADADQGWKYAVPTGGALGGDVLPSGGTVAVAVTLENPGDGAERLAISDNLRRKYEEIADTLDRSKPLFGTIKLAVPNGLSASPDPTFTVIVRDGTGRATSVSAASKFKVRPIPLSDLKLLLSIPNSGNEIAGELVLLADGGTTFDVQVRLNNSSPSTVTGKLMFCHSPPGSNLTGGTFVAEVAFPAGSPDAVPASMTNQTLLVKSAEKGVLTLQTDKVWYFWLEAVTDEFFQNPTVLPNRRSSTISFRRHPVEVRVEKLPAADGDGNTHKLVVENKDPTGFKLIQLLASVEGSEKFKLKDPAGIAGKTLVEIAKLKGIVAGDSVKVDVTYSFGTNDGIANFTAVAT